MTRPIVFTIYLVLICSLGASAQNRGSVEVKFENSAQPQTLYKASYALVIGESDYGTTGWDKLRGVDDDVKAVKAALEKQGFTVETWSNLTERQIDDTIHIFIKMHGGPFENRLLVYFAGHGFTDKVENGREIGYIVPVDAPSPSRDKAGFRQKAIQMDRIQEYSREVYSKHALFVFDSCFSGSLVSRGAIAIPPRILEEVKYPVRQFITAGAADQNVPDYSIFRRAFIRGIEGEADRNKDGYVLASELADYLKEIVIRDSNQTQTPQYGKIRDIELDRGDFVFVVPKMETGTAVVDPSLKSDLDQFLGKYHFEATGNDLEILKREGKYFFTAPGQGTFELEKVGGTRYHIKHPFEGYYVTVLGTEIYLEQPQGNYYLLRVKADGTTENYKLTEGLKAIVGIYNIEGRPDIRIEVTERGGAVLLLMPNLPIQRLREKTIETFTNSLYPDTFLIKTIRDTDGHLTGLSFVSPQGEIKYRRVL